MANSEDLEIQGTSLVCDQESNIRRTDSLKQFHEMLSSESDRGCVIVSAAIFDDILSGLLKQKLVPSIDKKDELFDNGSAALSSFSARIDLAYRLGLLKRNFRSTLHLVRKIRNDFAHVSEPNTFESSKVKSRILQIFNLNKEIMDAFTETIRVNANTRFEESNFIEVVGLRAAYEYLLAGLAASLLEAIKDVEKIQQFE